MNPLGQNSDDYREPFGELFFPLGTLDQSILNDSIGRVETVLVDYKSRVELFIQVLGARREEARDDDKNAIDDGIESLEKIVTATSGLSANAVNLFYTNANQNQEWVTNAGRINTAFSGSDFAVDQNSINNVLSAVGLLVDLAININPASRPLKIVFGLTELAIGLLQDNLGLQISNALRAQLGVLFTEDAGSYKSIAIGSDIVFTVNDGAGNADFTIPDSGIPAGFKNLGNL